MVTGKKMFFFFLVPCPGMSLLTFTFVIYEFVTRGSYSQNVRVHGQTFVNLWIKFTSENRFINFVCS